MNPTQPHSAGARLNPPRSGRRTGPRRPAPPCSTVARTVLAAWLGLAPLASTAATELGARVPPGGQQIELTLLGGLNCWHRLETSTNLADWQEMTTLYQSNAVSVWPDHGFTNHARRFYRSRDLSTALDRYVAAPDTNHAYTLLNTIPGAGQTTFILELQSQAWLTTNEVNRTLWKHWLILVKPTAATNSHCLLFISGGSNPGTPPSSADSNLRQIAISSGSVVAELKMIPNQPLTFAGESISRSEDSLIAYTWDKYLRTGDERWPARLPMTKAAVRAMDTITAFCASPAGGSLEVNRFVVSGASKRGWTTWTTAVVDRRVVAIVPLVIDVLNVEASMIHHYSAYGFWAPSIDDYVNMGIMNWMGTPQFQALMDIEDPYAYRARLTLPKFIINATGDEFFLPDSSQFYFDDLPGVKYLRYVPNTSHSLNADAITTLSACYQSIVFNTALPRFAWGLSASNSVRVVATDTPTEVRLWQAANPNARDFRLVTIGPAWQSTLLTSQDDGSYLGTVAPPVQGWKAFFVELAYVRAGLSPLKFTTKVFVVPDVLPFHYPP